MSPCQRCRDREELRNHLLDRIRRQERTLGDLFRDVLVAPGSRLAEFEGEVRRLEQGSGQVGGDRQAEMRGVP